MCTFCDKEIETIEHLFLVCEVTKAFLKKILNWFKYKTCMLVTVTNEQLLFGNTTVKYLILFCYKQRNMYILAGVMVNFPILLHLKVDSDVSIK